MALEPAPWPYWVLQPVIGAVTCLIAEESPGLVGVLVGAASGWALEVLLALGGVQTHLNMGGQPSELAMHSQLVLGLVADDLVAVALGFGMVRWAKRAGEARNVGLRAVSWTPELRQPPARRR